MISSIVMYGAAVLLAGLAGATLWNAAASRRIPQLEHPMIGDYLTAYLTAHPDWLTTGGRDAHAFAVWQLAGTSHIGLTDETRQRLQNGRIAGINRWTNIRGTIRVISLREPANLHMVGYPDVRNQVANELANRHAEAVATNTLRTTHYVILSTKDLATAMEDADTVQQGLDIGFREYGPKRLAASADGANATHPAQPLANFISPAAARRLPEDAGLTNETSDPDPVKALSTGVDVMEHVASDLLERTADGTVISRYGDTYSATKIVALRGLPQRASEGTMQNLLTLPHEVVIVQCAEPLSTTSQAVLATSSAGRNKFLPWARARAGESLAVASALRSELDVPDTTIWKVSLTVLCRGRGGTAEEAINDATAGARAVDGALLADGYAPMRNGPGCNASWWRTWPNRENDPRPWKLLALSWSAWTALQSADAGVEAHDWGPHAICRFRTPEGSTFGYTFHPTADRNIAAHTAIIAPTGGGKTTTMNNLMVHTMRVPKARITLFDRHHGCEIAVRALGGRYVEFDTAGEQTPDADEADSGKGRLNPFQLDDTPANRTFLRQWLLQAARAGSDDELPVAAAEEAANAVRLSYDHLPPELRNLRVLEGLAFHPRGTMAERMRRWTDPTQLGDIFTARRETLPTTADGGEIIAYDCTQAFDVEELSAPLISYLMHRMVASSRATAAPHLCLIDETEPMLRNPAFQRFFRTGLQEGRKLRTAYVCVFQRPAAIQDAGVADVIRQGCQTVIFLPNPNGDREEYQGYRLTERELEFVLGQSHRELRHAALIKRYREGATSTIIDTDLSHLGSWLRIYSSEVGDVAQFNELVDAHGTVAGTAEFIRAGER